MTQCLTVDLCIHLHQSLDEDSLMTIGLVINLITEMATSGYLSTSARILNWSHPYRFWGVSLAPGFYLTSKLSHQAISSMY